MKKGRIRLLAAISILLAVGIIAIFTIQVEVNPPGNTRIILERTNRTYISPPCFETTTTNDLSETTLSKAIQLEYEANSVCTEKSLKGVKTTIYFVILEKIGLKESSWNW
ncbi:hypothetical protein [Paenibacillus eucommiae]|uniref:Uncharacterized protein n=1 Tax=Paenibacillus eucommiae TaxID=1355755 RepID=A0ABS4IQ89_9BACL|nr:hypothetical protein [Paenibacillus eucommiae]MBP1989734.1 hypothetical protein [Paenibacillus eucommiae]